MSPEQLIKDWEPPLSRPISAMEICDIPRACAIRFQIDAPRHTRSTAGRYTFRRRLVPGNTDIEYSAPGGESLKLDAHIPEGGGPFPAIILVHGGGWVGGHKTVNFVQPLFPLLDQTGMAWFTIDYRLAPKHPYPAARLDVEAAVSWLKRNAQKMNWEKDSRFHTYKQPMISWLVKTLK
jgi:acetyl esterase/lipase